VQQMTAQRNRRIMVAWVEKVNMKADLQQIPELVLSCPSAYKGAPMLHASCLSTGA
jgi:hypothetical protein